MIVVEPHERLRRGPSSRGGRIYRLCSDFEFGQRTPARDALWERILRDLTHQTQEEDAVDEEDSSDCIGSDV